jgi:hypothetical protein
MVNGLLIAWQDIRLVQQRRGALPRDNTAKLQPVFTGCHP